MSLEPRRLRKIVQEIYDRRAGEVTVSPASLAAEAMIALDPDRLTDLTIASAANLQFRQIARAICRGVKPDHEESEQFEIDFHEVLQTRYPTARSVKSEDPEYVLLDHMSDEDFAWNIQRLTREADAKTAHARALAEYWDSKKHKNAA
jgi:hypothetical protein